MKASFSGAKSSGFTLVEVIIAMILLSVGLLTLLSVVLGGMFQRGVTREYDIARSAAFTKIEEIRAQDFSDIYTDYNMEYFEVPGLITPTGWTLPGKIVKIEKVAGIEVEFDGIDKSDLDLYDITVTIRWQIQGNTNALVFNEYIARSLMTRRSKY